MIRLPKLWLVTVASLLVVLPIATPLATPKTQQLPSPTSEPSMEERLDPGRVELFFKSPSELEDRVRFLRSCGVSSFNLVNKNKKDDVEGWVGLVRAAFPGASVCAHYSVKHNRLPRKAPAEQSEPWLRSLRDSDADEVLVVSGSGEKKAWNTVEALAAVGKSIPGNRPKIAVAYNPYFPSRSDQDLEDRRLAEKLATGCVSKVYLQFGTDPRRLTEGLETIRSVARRTPGQTDVEVAGSVFLPTKKLIAQQKFRPWNGVFLSEAFLSGPGEASAIVSETIEIYRANNVEMLWEAPGIRTKADMAVVRELLGAQSGAKPLEGSSTHNKKTPKGTSTAGAVGVSRERNKTATIGSSGKAEDRIEAEEAFSALRVLDNPEEDEPKKNDDSHNTIENDIENDIENENGEARAQDSYPSEEELAFLRSLEDIEPQPLEDILAREHFDPDGNPYDIGDASDPLAFFDSDLFDFLDGENGLLDLGGDTEPSVVSVSSFEHGEDSAAEAATEADPTGSADRPGESHAGPPSPGAAETKKDDGKDHDKAGDEVHPSTPNTAATTAATAASPTLVPPEPDADAPSPSAKPGSVLPEIALDFENDPFLLDPGEDVDGSCLGLSKDQELPGDACECCADGSPPLPTNTDGDTDGTRQVQQEDPEQRPAGEEIYPIEAGDVLDLETEDLLKELALLSLQNGDDTGNNGQKILESLLGVAPPSENRSALDKLMEPTFDDLMGRNGEAPFSYLSCQPCTPGDDGEAIDGAIRSTDAAVGSEPEGGAETTTEAKPMAGPEASDTPLGASEDPPPAKLPSALKLLMDPAMQPYAGALQDALAAPAVGGSQAEPPKPPSAMDLLMDPSMAPLAVGTDGLPGAFLCQPCTPDDYEGIASARSPRTAATNPNARPGGGLVPIAEGGVLSDADDSGAVADPRNREEYLRDLKALYEASAATERHPREAPPGPGGGETDELAPLDPMAAEQDYYYYQQQQQQEDQQQQHYEDYQRIAEQLRDEQAEKEFIASWNDAVHCAGAFGIDLTDEGNHAEGPDDTGAGPKKPSKKDPSKQGYAHKEVIYGISFSPDGKYAATASQDSMVCIWEVAKNRMVSTLKGHDVKYECLRVDWASREWAEEVLDRSSGFANLIVSGGADGKVKIWGCKDGEARDKNGLKTIGSEWKCEYTLDHANLLTRGIKEEAPDEEEDVDPGKAEEIKEERDKPQVYALQFIDDWKVFTRNMGQQQHCARHAAQEEEKQPEPQKPDEPDKNAFLMTSSDEFIHLWEIVPHSWDQQLALDGQKIRILQEKMKLKEVMSLHFGNLDQYSYGVTACSITGEGLQLPPPPATSSKAPEGTTPFGGEGRNPDNHVFVFDAAYSPGSGLLGVALADGSLRLVNGRGMCISVVNLPGNQSHLTSFCWDATGNRLATCVGTGHLITWSLDPESHQGGNQHTIATCTAIFEGGHEPGRPLFGTCFCGGDDENLLLSWGVDGKLCMWYSKARGNIYDPVAVLRDDEKYPIFDVEISPTGRHALIAGGNEGGFIGVPLHFYNLPPRAEAKEDERNIAVDGSDKPGVGESDTNQKGVTKND